MAAKDQARRIVEERLVALSTDVFLKKQAVTYENTRRALMQCFDKGATGRALLYQPIRAWNEVDVSALAQEFGDLTFDYLPKDATTPFPAVKYDVVVVPLLGFNDKGYRLGRGKGWYDRFLVSQSQAYKIGVGLDCGNIQFIHESHDVPMNSIATESTLLVFE